MKKPLLIVVSLLVLAPIGWILLYILVPQVRPDPTPEDLFLRLTGRTELPQSVTQLKAYVVVDPLLGDGTAIISFSISASEGTALVDGIPFAPGSRYGT